jgi:transcriptional regulator with XRE-family HTH domain
MKKGKSKAEKEAEQLQYFKEMFGQEVVRRYEAMGLTQKEFVFKSGIPQNTVSDVQLAKRNLSLAMMLKFTNGLDTTLSRFTSDDIFDKGIE